MFQIVWSTSQMYNSPSDNFPNLSQPQRSAQYTILAAVLGPLVHSSRSARPPSPFQPHRLALYQPAEVDAWEITHYLENFHLGNCQLGSRSRENANIKTHNTSFKDLKFGIMCSIKKALNIKRINLGFMNFYGNS